MKCEICKKDTHVAHIDDDHRKVCPDCLSKSESEGDGNCKKEKKNV